MIILQGLTLTFLSFDRLKLQKNFLDRNIHIDVLVPMLLIDNKKNHIDIFANLNLIMI